MTSPEPQPPAADISAETLKYLGLNPDSVEAHALVLVCKRYGLDPILHQARIIKTTNGNQVYIGRDGMLKIAHQSGQLDGIVVEEQRESENGYSATVTVWRKDMTHPFTYRGGCGIDEPQAKGGNGPEMALARAERRALTRAFDIPAYDDVDPADLPEVEHRMLPASDPADRWYTCTCGERFSTMAGFAAHKTPSGPVPVDIPAGPDPKKSRHPERRRIEPGPPVDYYDNLPEARGHA